MARGGGGALGGMVLAFVCACTSLTGSGDFREGAGGNSAEGRGDDAAADATDGARDGVAETTGDGGFSSDPRKIVCGALRCPLDDGRYCCEPSTNPICGTCAKTTSLRCDEKADCDKEMLCCLSASGDASCQIACAGSKQLCMTDAECKVGKCAPLMLGSTALGQCL